MNIEFRDIVDRESTNPAMSNNGDDYDFGRIVVVKDGVPVAVRYWTSAGFPYCPHCGMFNRCEERNGCGDPAPMQAGDVEGWEDAPILEGNRLETAIWRWENRRADMYQVFNAAADPAKRVAVCDTVEYAVEEYAPD